MSIEYDAIILGSGPNGLTAASTLAQAGLSVLVVEGKSEYGGGVRSSDLTLPGFVHDVCSAIFPLTVNSPYMSTLPLTDFGLKWVYSPVEVAHPLDNGTAILAKRSLDETSDGLDEDAKAYQALMRSIVDDWSDISEDLFGPLPIPPKHPLAFAGFSLIAARSASGIAKGYFKGERARALFAGMAGHSIMSLDALGSGAFGIVLNALAHTVGWPMVMGGSANLTSALVKYNQSLGVSFQNNMMVSSLEQLPQSRVVLLDITPRQFLSISGEYLPRLYRLQLNRYRYGPGVFKVDYALSNPVPWAASECSQAATVHLGGTMEEIIQAENDVAQGRHPEKPYILFVQQSLFDQSRAPEWKHTAWAYCHVPNGSTFDMTERIEAQIERFAPGFREVVLARQTRNSIEMEAYNPNYVGGDIVGGSQDLRQLYTRPVPRLNPYSTPLKNVFLCSSSTPPGGGVHGMCGHFAAKAALASL